MTELFRDTVAGFLIRIITAKKFVWYPEEIPGFKIPTPVGEDVSDDSTAKSVDEKDVGEKLSWSSKNDEDVEQGNVLQPALSQIIHPVVTKDGIILVDWYSEVKSWTSTSKPLCIF